MDVIPLELVSHICSFACNDDGTTFKSLRATNKYLRQVCFPMQYQSLSLNGHEDVAHLGEKLQAIPEHLRRIFHLHLSLPFPDPRSLHDNMNHLTRLLLLASPTLETLAFSTPTEIASSTVIARLFRTPFPHLTELSIHGYYPFPDPAMVEMPLLERLHLSGNRNPYGLLPTLKGSFPSLTHLRLSGLSVASSFARDLESHMKSHHCSVTCPRRLGENRVSFRAVENSEILDHTPVHTSLPPRLQYIVVQTETRRRGTVNSMKKDAAMMEILRSCVDTHAGWREGAGKNSIRVSVGAPHAGQSSPCTLLYKNWSDRLMGGRGCWES
ncbi:hypothetical protein V5O48_011835 [Marasmius crinis-equi]|uniref:F-box domain-containing protein n=1 Tax=Marasmius crinis-equi TaxID=585013 RepID=A0ABR3F503_9AGAR